MLPPDPGASGGRPHIPSRAERVSRSMIMGMTGLISKCFLSLFNRVEVVGLDRFVDMLDRRRDPESRERGLLTVSNHESVIDDPVMWGVLPVRHLFNPGNMRFGLGAHDICFQNKLLSAFFTAGQVLPTHRLAHSPHGGLFQPSIAEAIRLLSDPHRGHRPELPSSSSPSSTLAYPSTFATTGADSHRSPSCSFSYDGSDPGRRPYPHPHLYPYPRNRHAWVHVFPEGMVHQHTSSDLRYFRWGVARLILEADPPPDVLPVFVDGTQLVLPEDRGFPRLAPRVGKRLRVAFGEVLDYDRTFGDLRKRWEGLVRRSLSADGGGGGGSSSSSSSSSISSTKILEQRQKQYLLGELPDDLKYSAEAREIRIEVARRVREELLKVRRSLGDYPEPDPAFGLAQTWAVDKNESHEKKYKSKVDGSDINQA